jgi:CDP-diacylglycerol--glycerol-3-phosphate 3-phosphatidyltransferase
MKKFVLFLTLFRILAGPVIFLLAIFFEATLLALFIFIAASISDFLDGKLARDYNVESSLGAILDPIADKILILFALIALSIISSDPFVAFISALILAREFWVSSMREYAANNFRSDATKVTFLGKTKTAFQFFAISIYFFSYSFDLALMIFIGKFLLIISLLLAYKSAIEYTQKSLSL